MTPVRFLETNILLRQITRDLEFQAVLTDQLFSKIADGEIDGLLSMTVLFETAYVLEGFYKRDRPFIAEALRLVTGVDGVRLLDGETEFLTQTLDLYLAHRKLSIADCYHSVLSLSYCNGEIYTFDKEFDRVPNLTRLEPGA